MQIGIVGLPFSGKTTFFQTLTVPMSDQSTLQKRDSNLANIKVPDERLDKFTAIFNPKKKVNATIEIIDFVGIQKGDSGSTTFINNFLAKMKLCDALIHVVRGFEDTAFPHPEGSNDILRDVRNLEDELIFSDMAFAENRLEKLEKDIFKQKIKDQALKEKEIILKWNEALQNNIPLRDLDIDEEESKLIRNYQMLTAKPVLIAVNLDVDMVSESENIVNKIKENIKGKNIEVVPFFAKIEMELSQLPDDDKEIFMGEYGIKESALSKMIRAAYNLLGVHSFFTVGEDECRAWTIKRGFTAQEAAGSIHTDFYNKFIRAEVVSYKDFMECGTFAKCKEKGVFRLEGKEYIVKDGDILHVRHG